MKKLNATEFKAKCLKLLDELSPEGLVITKRGEPIARVLPYKRKGLSEFYGALDSEIKVKGDFMSTGLKWNAES